MQVLHFFFAPLFCFVHGCIPTHPRPFASLSTLLFCFVSSYLDTSSSPRYFIASFQPFFPRPPSTPAMIALSAFPQLSSVYRSISPWLPGGPDCSFFFSIPSTSCLSSLSFLASLSLLWRICAFGNGFSSSETSFFFASRA